MMHRMSALTQLAEKMLLFIIIIIIIISRIYKKMIVWYCMVYNQIASDVWRYNNPIYKFMANNEQTATGVN